LYGFDCNSGLMASCPNGPCRQTQSFDAEHEADWPVPHRLEVSRVSTMPDYYILMLETLSGEIVFHDTVYWSKAQELVEQFENEYAIIDL
jgi:hypothetical protein